MIDKVYTSKDGYRFRIVDFHHPAEGDIVHFTRAEYEWIKAKKLSSDEFKVIYMLKAGDYTYDPADVDLTEAQRLAKKYGNVIISALRFGDVDKAEQVQCEEGSK